jgi:hypothetical protein
MQLSYKKPRSLTCLSRLIFSGFETFFYLVVYGRLYITDCILSVKSTNKIKPKIFSKKSTIILFTPLRPKVPKSTLEFGY